MKAGSTEDRDKVVQVVDSTGAEIVDIGKSSITVEESGDEHRIKALVELLRPYGITEIVRTGKIAVQCDKTK